MEQLIPADSLPNPLPTLPQLPPKKSKVRKVIMTIFLIIVVPPLLLYIGWLSILATAKDGPPPGDKDLQLEKVNIPDSDNAYFDLMKIANSSKPSSDDDGYAVKYINGEVEWNDKIAKEIIDRNKDVLSNFAAAASKLSFQDPTLADPKNISMDTPLMPLNSVRKAGRLGFIEATYLQKQGKEKEAFNKAFQILEVGQKMQESQGAMIYYLVGQGLKSGIGLRFIVNTTGTTKMANKDLLPYVEKLREFKDDDEGFKKVFKGEYIMGSSAIDSISKGIAKAKGEKLNVEALSTENKEPLMYINTLKNYNYYWEPNNTKKLFADLQRERIRNVEKPCGYISKDASEAKKLAPTDSYIRLLLTENAIGKILYDVTYATLNTVFYKRCERDFIASTAQTLIAVKAYSNDNKTLPNSLNELVPKYLTKIPEDPFSGKELRYSKEKKIIYSVGLNLTDAGGSDIKNWNLMYEADDPTIKIAF